MQIAGQTAIVTGGASGLGRATATALASRGARVAILDANVEAARAAADASGAIAVTCDVRSPDSVIDAIRAVKKRIGTPRICVNCAGIGPAKRILGRQGAMALDDFARVIEVNLIGSFNVLRLVAAEMAALDPLPTRERGVVINTASIAAYEGQIGQAAYAASKGGVVSLTLPAARIGAARDPRTRRRTGHLSHTHAGGAARTRATIARRCHPVPAATWQPDGVRRARNALGRERDA